MAINNAQPHPPAEWPITTAAEDINPSSANDTHTRAKREGALLAGMHAANHERRWLLPVRAGWRAVSAGRCGCLACQGCAIRRHAIDRLRRR